MKGYGERVIFGSHLQSAWARATLLVERVGHHLHDNAEVRCHELARAVCECLACVDLTVVDGRCGPVEHSWIVSDAQFQEIILDVYVPGRLPMVQLVDPMPLPSSYYRRGAAREDIRRTSLRRLVQEMRR